MLRSIRWLRSGIRTPGNLQSPNRPSRTSQASSTGTAAIMERVNAATHHPTSPQNRQEKKIKGIDTWRPVTSVACVMPFSPQQIQAKVTANRADRNTMLPIRTNQSARRPTRTNRQAPGRRSPFWFPRNAPIVAIDMHARHNRMSSNSSRPDLPW